MNWAYGRVGNQSKKYYYITQLSLVGKSMLGMCPE